VSQTEADLRRIIREETAFRVGSGFDVHRFAEGRPMILGGVEIECDVGLLGHSDADVVVHAAMDAVLGAAGLPDIGNLFPDTDEQFRGADSLELARRVAWAVHEAGWSIVNLDLAVMAEKPRLSPHVAIMRERMGGAFGLEPWQIGIKATTMEKLGFIGRSEGIAALATALLRHYPSPSREETP
jgi:2-C-methyl-D-erythritol 2,4-cyclodiphosphate synthase